MSSPTPSTSGSELGGMRQSQAAYPTSLLALSGLLKVQRVWSNTSNAGEMPNTIERQPPRADASPPGPTATGRSRPAFHLEDSEWSRLAIGVAADAMASLGLTASGGRPPTRPGLGHGLPADLRGAAVAVSSRTARSVLEPAP